MTRSLVVARPVGDRAEMVGAGAMAIERVFATTAVDELVAASAGTGGAGGAGGKSTTLGRRT